MRGVGLGFSSCTKCTYLDAQDLEFASLMVQNLNIILITSPELSDLRKRLKNLDTKVCCERGGIVNGGDGRLTGGIIAILMHANRIAS